MKNRLITILITTIMALSLTACGDSVVENADTVTESATMFERHKFDTHHSILIDKKTGVCYLEYKQGYKYGITVMLNADGTPKIWGEE